MSVKRPDCDLDAMALLGLFFWIMGMEKFCLSFRAANERLKSRANKQAPAG
jgi:hypothetical protein